MEFIRRLCEHPHDSDITHLLIVCPDLWEISTGDFIAIGKDVTNEIIESLPADASISKNERVILLPRRILTSAKKNIPEK